MFRASIALGLKKLKPVPQIDILVVESNPADSFLTEEAFKAVGLNSGLHCVREGPDAFSYLLRKRSYRDVTVPDLIFIDLSQPTTSALNLLKMIKSTPKLMYIPTVVAAGLEDPKFVKSVYALNGTCFIRKPLDLVEFVQLIQTCCQFWSSILMPAPTLRARISRPPRKHLPLNARYKTAELVH